MTEARTTVTLPNGVVLQFSICQGPDVNTCAVIEAASYPKDEAASPAQLVYRQANAGSFFLVCKHQIESNDDDDDEVIGFICGTLCHTMTEESMSQHDPDGALLAIHSVAVAAAHRRKGVATAMLQHYVSTTRREHSHLQKMVLLAKAHLLSFYWFDLELDLGLGYSTVDAFVIDPSPAGTGNPAAVVVIPQGRENDVDDAWMQRVAAEFNLAETAFLWPSSASSYRIRYFSPMTEVDLCGHATLAAAAVLQQAGAVTFTANHNVELMAEYDPVTALVTMQFPGQPVTLFHKDGEDRAKVQRVETMLQEALLIPSESILALGVVPGLGDLFVHVAPATMEELVVKNLDVLRSCPFHTRGVIVCCDRGGGVVASRFFAPKAGIPEDPVTGSAHCAIAPYFTRGQPGVLSARQESPRGGHVQCRVDADGLVHLTGKAITTMEGSLRL